MGPQARAEALPLDRPTGGRRRGSVTGASGWQARSTGAKPPRPAAAGNGGNPRFRGRRRRFGIRPARAARAPAKVTRRSRQSGSGSGRGGGNRGEARREQAGEPRMFPMFPLAMGVPAQADAVAFFAKAIASASSAFAGDPDALAMARHEVRLGPRPAPGQANGMTGMSGMTWTPAFDGAGTESLNASSGQARGVSHC